jgi:hypothetical protein
MCVAPQAPVSSRLWALNARATHPILFHVYHLQHFKYIVLPGHVGR